MAVQCHVFGKAPASLVSGLVNFGTGSGGDTIKAILLAAFTPAALLDTAQFLSDISPSYTEATGGGNTGYTAGGQAITGKTITTTAANSWATQRAASTAYLVGDIVRPAAGNGTLLRCVIAGTSGSSLPTYVTTIGADISDGSVTWEVVGNQITVLAHANPAWTTINPGTLVAAYVGFFKDTGTASTSPVLAYWDLGGSQSASNGGVFSPQLNSTTGLLHFVTS